jgi:membrane-bound serine protease (ClpP class)
MMASMKKGVLYIIAYLFILQTAWAQKVISIEIDGTINPVAADYVHRSIEKANKENADCLIIKLNTPGGLLKSTRVIVSDLLDSPVPVVVYVSPNGAHAGSAGVFITMAAHVAAMAPGTNIGAAHPVSMQQQMDPVMNEKATNDATAFIRTIAQYRNRDTVWAEKAVRYSLSITASEALSQKVIDLVAGDMNQLLEQINGKEVMTPSGKKIISTHNAAIETVKMSWIEKLLNILVDPNIAYILLLLGIYGLLFELYSPGVIFPGVIGGICIILAFYSMHTLPVNYAALALIVFAVILFILEIKIISHGILAIGGTISLLLGSLMLIRNESSLEFARISRAVIYTVVAFTALFFFFLVTMGLRAQRKKPVTGTDAFEGAIGFAAESFDQTGTIMIMGELWQAESVAGKIEKGQKLKVTRRENLKLFVEPIPV